MATRKRAAARPRVDPLREVAYDVYCAFDAEDATPAMQVEFVDGCLETARSRGIDADLESMLPHCAHVLGLDGEELRATYDQRHARERALAAVRGQPGEFAALAALRDATGRHGATFDDAAAATLGAAWPRVGGPELTRALFTGATDLRLQNLGPLPTLAGFDAIKGLGWLEVEVTPTCDLSPLAQLPRLRVLVLGGKLEGYGPLAAVKSLVQLTVTATERGLGELAALPRLRVLTLTVAPEVPLAGLLALKSLNLLTLYAGPRELDDATRATIHALARKKSRKLWLYPGEGWPTELELGVATEWRVTIN